jgi:FkbM family methyltransferase
MTPISFQQTILHDIFLKNPVGFIDVGARFGCHALVDKYHDYVSFLGFEPDLVECDRLNQNEDLKQFWHEFKILPHALADCVSQKKLHILTTATNSSLLKPNSVYVERYQMQEKWSIKAEASLQTATLDQLIYHEKLGFMHSGEIIKLDTQGTEYDILVGAQQLLSSLTVCVVTEVEFFEIYQGQKLFSEVELFLRNLGFSFYGFLTQHTRSQKKLNKQTHFGKERLFYADAIFFKDPFSINNSLTLRQYQILLIAAMLTEFYDFALEILFSGSLAISSHEIKSIQHLINSLAYVDPTNTEAKLHSLIKSLSMNPKNTNITLGKFVDNMKLPNFEDC